MKWVFPLNGGGEQDGFNNASIDTFKGERIFSLVRETIQNSMDARLDGTKPVRVTFSLSGIKSADAVGIGDLELFLSLAKDTAQNQFGDKSAATKFFNLGLKLLKQPEFIIFGIHDFNTTGLTGPTVNKKNQKVGHWLALIKGSGLSVKASDSALGSFGHGSKAPFAVSQIRSIFYFSKIDDPESEIRFQGKSILQSMETPEGNLTQGTGYFSKNDECDAVVNEEVPDWPIDIRSKLGNSSGTSILIPFPDLGIEDNEIWRAIKISILSNFYYAIRNSNLEVGFNDTEILNKENLQYEFSKLVSELEQSTEIREQEYLRMIKSSITIQFPTEEKSGILNSDYFGKIEWFLRLGETVDWRSVGIARQNGMLITNTAPGLERFPGTKPFDLFLAVIGEEGARTLRLLENPAHTAFEFDRIDDKNQRKLVKGIYDSFVREIRELLRIHASLDASSEIYIDDLNDFFGGNSNPTNHSGKSELSNKILIGKIRKPIALNKGIDDEDSGNSDQDNLPNPDPGVEINITGGGNSNISRSFGGNQKPQSIKSKINDPRISRMKNEKNSAVIYFTPQFNGGFELALCKSGETISEFIGFQIEGNNEWIHWHKNLTAEKNKRMKINVNLPIESFDYALEIVVRNDS